MMMGAASALAVEARLEDFSRQYQSSSKAQAFISPIAARMANVPKIIAKKRAMRKAERITREGDLL